MLKRLGEIAERRAALLKELDAADEKRVAEIETEVDQLDAEEKELRKKVDLQGRLGQIEDKPEGRSGGNKTEERAAEFARSNRTSVNTRALLLSGGKIAQATEVAAEIKDAYGVEVSSLVDMVTVTDCTGMGTYRVAYEIAGLEAGDKTEGTAPADGDVQYDFVDLNPAAFSVLSYVSKQIKKQTPLMYENKVLLSARTALRKKASKKIIESIYASTLVKAYPVNAAKIDEKTLRNIAFAYGGDEGIGGGILILNKNDLVAFGDVRGTNEKKAVYEITPDAANENTGIIKDGGLAVRYVINSNCNALTGATESAKTMIYGNPKNVEMALWGDIDVSTSEDYKFAENMLTVLGETLLDAAVVVKNGFVVVDYAKV